MSPNQSNAQAVYECIDKITQFVSKAAIFSFLPMLTWVCVFVCFDIWTFEEKTGMKHSTFNLCKAKKIKSGDILHIGSTPVAAGVGDKYGTGQILQEQVRLKDKIFSTFAVK